MSRENWNGDAGEVRGDARPSVCVVGLGYIGLPTAIFLAAGGHTVLGVDIQPERVAAVNSGALPVDEPGLDAMFETAVRGGRLRASTAVGPADAFFICVPTPSRPSARYEGEEAELGAVQAAARAVARALRPGNLVVLESTVPPGTTDGLVRAILEESGLTVHRDGDDAAGAFYLAHCPERVIPGRIAHELVHNDRVIGGSSRAAAERAATLYRTFVRGEIALTDATTAEMVKLMENTFRDVNIALANEFANLCERLGIDVWEAIRLANRHPRVTIHRPGPGVGGHCIPVDPWFIVERAPEEAPLIRQARRVNGAMPHRVVDRALALLGQATAWPARVAALGLTYKADVDDVRESPALEVVAGLLARGMDVAVHDPFVPPERCARLEFPGQPREDGAAGKLACSRSALEAADGADLLLFLVPHSAFRQLTPAAAAARLRQPLVFDACGALDSAAAAAWRAAGFRVARLGVGDAALRAGADRSQPAPVAPGRDGESGGR